MFNIFKQLKEQQEEIRGLQSRFERELAMCDMYRKWYFAYKNATLDLCEMHAITEEQKELIMETARKYQED